MKNGRQILWNVIPICETSQISYLMGRRPMKDVLGNHSKDRLFRFVHWLSITLLLRKISPESINLERKFYLDCSLDTLCTRGEFGRVAQWSQTLRSWKRWTNLEIYSKRLNAQVGYFTKKMEILFFQSQMDESNFQELRTSTLIRDHPIRGEGQRDFLGESEGSPPPPPQDSLPDAGVE